MLALAAVLLSYRLGAKDIWIDEAGSWEMATRSVPSLIAGTALDIHPPLYYLVLKGWIGVWGDSLIAMRSFSVVSGLAALWLMFELGAALRLPAAALCAAVAWCAVSPHTVFYGQEARMYPLLTALVLGTCLSYRRWIDSGGEDRRWLAAYVVCALAALYTHYFASLIVLALLCHSLVAMRSARTARFAWRWWLSAHLAILLAYAVWLPIAIGQLLHAEALRAGVSFSDLPGEVSLYAREMLFGHLRLPNLWSITSLALLAVLIVGLVGTVVRSWRRHDERASFLALLAIVPSIVGLGVLPWTGHLELPRYLSYSLPLVILAAAYGFMAWRLPASVVVGALVIGAATPLPYLTGYYAASATDYDSRPLVNFLTETLDRPDAVRAPVYVAPGYVADMLRYWTRDAISYVRVTKPATFQEIVDAAATAAEPSWLVVDYRSPAIDAIGADSRFIRVSVPSSSSERIRLYRWVGSEQ